MMGTSIDHRSTPPGTTRQWVTAYLAPASVVLLALALNLYKLESKSLWFDELATLTGTGWGGSWLDAIIKPLTIPATAKPPLYFLVSRAFLTLGDRVFLLRLPAAYFATLSVPLVYVLGKALFDRRVGLLGALLLAMAPLSVRYAQEARMYSMLTFLCMLELYLFWRAIHARQLRWWLGFSAVAVLALYTHLLALLPLGVMVLFALWLLLKPTRGTKCPFRFWHLALAMAAILLAWAPMLGFMFRGLTGAEGLGGLAAADWGLVPLVGTVRLFSGGTDLGALFYGLFFVLGAIGLARHHPERLLLILLWTLLPVAIIVLPPFAHQVYIRYYLFSLPLYLLVVAVGLLAALSWAARQADRWSALPRARAAATALAACALLAILVGLNAPSVASYYAEGKQNWRDATWLVQDLAQPGETVFVRHVYHQTGVLFYSKLRPQGLDLTREARVEILPSGSSTSLGLADDERAWLIVPPENYLPGSQFDVVRLPHHSLLEPTVFQPDSRSRDWGLISPISVRSVAVVPVVPSPRIHFWADDSTLPSAPGGTEGGNCTWLRWEVENVREVYLDGNGVVGHDARQVCPTATTRYQLEVIDLDGNRTSQAIEITVRSP